jgi:hypothetical protein
MRRPQGFNRRPAAGFFRSRGDPVDKVRVFTLPGGRNVYRLWKWHGQLWRSKAFAEITGDKKARLDPEPG